MTERLLLARRREGRAKKIQNRPRGVSDFGPSRGLMGMDLSMTAPDPRKAFLADAAIVASLRKAIASRVPAQEVDDLAQATMLEAWTAVDYPPEREGFGRWLALKGRSNAIDFLRKAARRKRRLGHQDGEVDDVPAAHAEPAHDALDGLRFVQARLDERDDAGSGAQRLLRSVRGDSFAEIAEDEGTSEEAVRKSVRRVRTRLIAAWAAVAAIALFWILRALFGRNPQEEHAHPDTVSSAVPPEAPALSTDPAPTPEQYARALRERALRECAEKNWTACLRDLQSASSYDPKGDSDPQVRRARDEATSHIQWKPPM
jgi:RNA polymerase sigma factor (sigma-70 family)